MEKVEEGTLPCPFCGRADMLLYTCLIPREGKREHRVLCQLCRVQGPVDSTKKKSIRKWNRRYP